MARPAEFDGSGISFDAANLIALRSHVMRRRLPSNALVALPGGFNIRRRGNGQETADSRAYVAGDDLRHIDRGATARTGHMHTRTFHEERDRVTHLVADFRPSMLWGMKRAFQSVAMAEALALIGWQTVEEGGRIGLVAVTGEDMVVIPPRGRVRGMLDVIGGLVKAQDMAFETALDGLKDPPFDLLLEGLKRITAKGSEIIIATGLNTPGEGFDEFLAELNQRRHPRLLIVQDHAASNLPAGHYPLETPDGKRVSANPGANSVDESRTFHVGIETRNAIPKLEIDAGATVAETIRELGI